MSGGSLKGVLNYEEVQARLKEKDDIPTRKNIKTGQCELFRELQVAEHGWSKGCVIVRSCSLVTAKSQDSGDC